MARPRHSYPPPAERTTQPLKPTSPYLPSPTTSSLVSRTHAGIRRTLGTAQLGKTPTLVDDLKRMLEKLPSTRVGLRDRALLLLGFAGAFRRSELVSLDVSDLEFTRAGLVVTLRKSKTDQEGKSRRLGIPYGSSEGTCPVRSLQAWLESAHVRKDRCSGRWIGSASAARAAFRQGRGSCR